VRLDGGILEVMAPAPRPDNYRDLGLRTRSPPGGRFRTNEAPHWSSEALVKAIGKVLDRVKGKAARNIAPRIVYRLGHQGGDGSVIFLDPPTIFTRKLAQARLISPNARTAAGAVRHYLDDFVSDFELTTQEEYEAIPYVLEVGVALQKNVRPYTEPKAVNSREWAKRYNASRSGTSKTTKPKPKPQKKARKKVKRKAKVKTRVGRGVRHRDRKKLGKVPRRRRARKGR
jgi:hypothetical protein